MRSTIPAVAALAALGCLVPRPAAAQTLDEIIALNLKAKGASRRSGQPRPCG